MKHWNRWCFTHVSKRPCSLRLRVTWKLTIRSKTKLTKKYFETKALFKSVLDVFFEPKSIQNCYVYETRTADHWNQGGEGLLGFSMLRSLFTWFHDRKLLPLCWKFLKLYPQFPFWILIALDKIYFACIDLIRAKIRSLSISTVLKWGARTVNFFGGQKLEVCFCASYP